MNFREIDGCPVPAELYDELVEIRRLAREEMPCFIYNSIYRGSDSRALAILKKYGKSTQAMLYKLFLAGRGNPANPPGYSTHELFNDGVAYAVPRGAPLRYWMVGIDSSSAAVFCRAAAKRQWIATVTYPNNPREAQHANLRKEPKFVVFKPLRLGQSSPRVRDIRRRLAFVKSPTTKLPYLASSKRKAGKQTYFDAELTAALKLFQREHHQAADGVYGPATAKQLDASVRYRKAANKKERKKR